MWTGIILPLSAGLGLFLFGMKVMEFALNRWAGPYFKEWIQRFTKTPWRGMLAGTAITAVVQSSSAVTVITIGLVNAGLITFSQTLGVILGTNIGTCLTTELIGMSLNSAASTMFYSAAAVWLLSWAIPASLAERSEKISARIRFVRMLTLTVAGFSCILLGIEIMQTIVPELKSRGFFGWFLEQSKQSLLWGVIAGACLTAVIHSSTAAIAMTMGLAAVHAIPVDLGIAVVLGANIGTCVTALVASIGGTRSGVYVAWFHVLINAGGAALFFPFIHVLETTAGWMTDSPSSLLARTQTIFNIVTSLVFLPICYLPKFRFRNEITR